MSIRLSVDEVIKPIDTARGKSEVAILYEEVNYG